MWEVFVLLLALSGEDQPRVGVDTRSSYATYADCIATISDRLKGFEKPASENSDKLVFAMGCRKIKNPDDHGA